MDWDKLSDNDWNEFAKHWLADMTNNSSNGEYSQSLLMLNFMGSSEANWKFIQTTINHAISDEELGHLAAGPLEHFISKHGKDYTDQIERVANSNEKFERLLTGVWQHLTCLLYTSPSPRDRG